MNTNIICLARSLMRPSIAGSWRRTQPVSQSIKPTLLKPDNVAYKSECIRSYSSLTRNAYMDVFNQKSSKTFLSPVISTVIVEQPKAGFKLVQNPKRRCKHCYIVIEEERKFVFCDKYPRHKQAQIQRSPIMKVSRIMTHATQGGTKSSARMGMWTQQGLREDY